MQCATINTLPSLTLTPVNTKYAYLSKALFIHLGMYNPETCSESVHTSPPSLPTTSMHHYALFMGVETWMHRRCIFGIPFVYEMGK